jgi:hypothetical protein
MALNDPFLFYEPLEARKMLIFKEIQQSTFERKK